MNLILVLLAISTTAPATQQTDETELRHIIAVLQSEVADLKQENEHLRLTCAAQQKKLADLSPKPIPKSASPADTQIAKAESVTKGMSLESVTAMMGHTPDYQTDRDGEVEAKWKLYVQRGPGGSFLPAGMLTVHLTDDQATSVEVQQRTPSVPAIPPDMPQTQ